MTVWEKMHGGLVKGIYVISKISYLFLFEGVDEVFRSKYGVPFVGTVKKMLESVK